MPDMPSRFVLAFYLIATLLPQVLPADGSFQAQNACCCCAGLAQCDCCCERENTQDAPDPASQTLSRCVCQSPPGAIPQSKTEHRAELRLISYLAKAADSVRPAASTFGEVALRHAQAAPYLPHLSTVVLLV